MPSLPPGVDRYGAVRCVHLVTGEVCGWTTYDRAEAWLAKHDVIADWDILSDCHNPAWKLNAAMLPGPDGRVDGTPIYETAGQAELRRTRPRPGTTRFRASS
ncbi:MAG TPA: hypothetical protein VGL46_14875 [Pseudonocardiaceae bacterium]